MDLSLTRRLSQTPFTSRIVERGAQAFTVYNHMLLPTVFESLEADDAHLRSAVQVWDVSVERQVEISGPDATRLVQWMAPRDVSKVEAGRCVYLPLVDEYGKMINDPIGLKLADDRWWLSIADSDVLLWAKGLAYGANMNVTIREPAVWPLAVQGPLAETLMTRVFGDRVPGIRFFRFEWLDYRGHAFLVARSGWSKQGGFEIYVDDAALGVQLFDELFEQGENLNVRPGCPNSIERIESGLLSYGNDMDIGDTPLEVGLEGFLTLDADIDAMSLAVLREQRDTGVQRQLKGLILETPEATPFAAFGIDGSPLSEIRSQVFSPRLGKHLAFAMLEGDTRHAETLSVLCESGTRVEVNVASLPFSF